MSFRAMAWAMEQEVRTTAKMVLMVLANYTNDKGLCWPSYETIKELSGIRSDSTMAAALKELGERGLASKKSRYQSTKGKVSKTSNLYRLSIPSNFEATKSVTTGIEDSHTPKIEVIHTTGIEDKPIKEPVKEPVNKKATSLDQKFKEFYAAYPVKKSKGAAIKAFNKLNPDDNLLEKILTAIENQKSERDRVKAKGKDPSFWKHPSTWLNQQCWEDEVELPDNSRGVSHSVDGFVGNEC